jgi:hypothetical protein
MGSSQVPECPFEALGVEFPDCWAVRIILDDRDVSAEVFEWFDGGAGKARRWGGVEVFWMVGLSSPVRSKTCGLSFRR